VLGVREEQMKIKHYIAAFFLVYAIRLLYLLFVPIQITNEINSSCFEEGCVVFEGDWLSFKDRKYTHQVFTDDLSDAPEVPYVEYEGKLSKLGNFYYLNEALMENKAYIAVKNSYEVSVLSPSWFLLYSVSNSLPVYRHVQKSP
jgi:hypothetical protein